MPLTSIQQAVLRLLADQRREDSYIAGSTPLNLRGNRFSKDIDIFHDEEEQVETIASRDAGLLVEAGYQVAWQRRMKMIHTARVTRDDDKTELEWVADSDYRFFPTIPHPTFGFTLHPVDLAANKLMALASRRELRDLVDLLRIHEHILPLGALLWATVEKFPGFSPESLLSFVRRNSHYPRIDWEELNAEQPVDPLVFYPKLRATLDAAEEFLLAMPSDKVGLLFLENNRVVQPDPRRLDAYATHRGQRRGHWPSSFDIEAAMFEAQRALWAEPPMAD